MPARLIDPEVAEILAAVPSMIGELDGTTLDAIRKQSTTQLEYAPRSDQVLREDRTVPGPPGAPDIVVRLYRPVELTSPAPCVYSIHGGGYVIGSRDMDDLRFDNWCPTLGVVGVSVEYRLAPETPFPGPLEDCYAGLAWVFANADALGVDPARIGISGISAGGGLAAGLALLARDRSELRPAFQLLTYPMLDDRQITPSSSWDVPIWTPANNEFGWRSYLGPLYGAEEVPYIAAPARADDLTGLPPTLITVGTADGFCDEDIIYAQRLNHAGVPVELHVYPGGPHGFEAMAPTARISRQCHRDTAGWLAAMIGHGGGEQ